MPIAIRHLFLKATLSSLLLAFIDVRLSPQTHTELTSSALPPSSTQSTATLASPDDRLGEALSELRRSVTAEILESLGSASPAFFETVVLELLHRMGYGTSRTDVQRVGGVGDAGIDGVISLYRLGL